jgi:hypothetical protein
MDFGGNVEKFAVMAAPNATHGFTPVTPSIPAPCSPDAWGAPAVGAPAHQPAYAKAGAVAEQCGGQIFERVLISPQAFSLGTVFTQQQIEVTIWNTFRSVEEFMTALPAVGTGSAILPPYTFPVGLAPLSQIVAIITIPAQGDPSIDETITFLFPAVEGTALVLTGQRLAVFSVEADWSAGITETPQMYLTDVLRGLTDNEQRVQLRTLPRSRIKFKVLPTGLETALLESLLLAWQQYLFGVPFWPDKQPLLAPVDIGDRAISFDWTDREFAPGGYLLLWRDAFTLEIQTVEALVGGGATLDGPVQNAWAADGRTWVVPIRRGRLPAKVDLVRKNQDTAEADVTFDIEVV